MMAFSVMGKGYFDESKRIDIAAHDQFRNDDYNLQNREFTASTRKFVPRKAAVKVTEKARNIFKKLLQDPPRPDIVGIMLNYTQSQTGEPRMVYSFDFVTGDEISPEMGDEGVSLEVVESEQVVIHETTGERTMKKILTPKLPEDSATDGLPKFYVHHNAFLKVLGSTVDVDLSNNGLVPVLYDREGNIMDPNA
jgi:hypothetical protein